MLDVDICFLPRLLEGVDLTDRQAVVIDVLRASTTIVHALAAGARNVLPCGTVEDARRFAATAAASGLPALLGGERQGQQIPGFDLDNSPLKYTPESVAGRQVIFTTTNGTRALEAVRGAGRILVGAFVNRRALEASLLRDGRPVVLLCAGTDGFVTAEDVLFAGVAARSLRRLGAQGERASSSGARGTATPGAAAIPGRLSAQRDAAIAFATAYDAGPAERLAVLRESLGGRNLIELGFDADIARAAEDSLFDLVPEFRPGEGVIVRSL